MNIDANKKTINNENIFIQNKNKQNLQRSFYSILELLSKFGIFTSVILLLILPILFSFSFNFIFTFKFSCLSLLIFFSSLIICPRIF